MDKKLARCVASLKQEANSAKCGFVPDLKPLVEDLRDLCKDLFEPRDVSVACALIFEEDNGLFGAVESLILVRDREAQKARETILDFLAEFIKQIGLRALPYAALIKVGSWFDEPYSTGSYHCEVQPMFCNAIPTARLISKLQEKSLKIFTRDDAKSVQAASLTLLMTFFELGMLKEGVPNCWVDQQIVNLLLKEFRRAKTSSTCKHT